MCKWPRKIDDERRADIIKINKINERESAGGKKQLQNESSKTAIWQEWENTSNEYMLKTQEGVNWRCASCNYQTQNQGSLRNHLAVMRRHADTGKVICPYCGKKEKHIGDLKLHIVGYIGRKCKKIPNARNGPGTWNDIIAKTREMINDPNTKHNKKHPKQ